MGYDCSKVCKDKQADEYNEFGFNKESQEIDKNLISLKEKKPKTLIKADPSTFRQEFNDKLDNFGNFIAEEDFNNFINEKIQKTLKDEPLNQPDFIFYDKPQYENPPIQFKNGNIYSGNWNDNIEMEGKGLYYLQGENVLADGFWVKGNLVYARVFLPNGDIYEGEMKNQIFNGNGKMKYKNGEFYEGTFKNGLKDGKGTIKYPDGTIYHGDIVAGLFEGKGSMKWPDGTGYEGLFSKNRLNGEGLLTNTKGERYQGKFNNNLFNGKGEYTFMDESLYDGEFENGKLQGKGLFKVPNEFYYYGNWDEGIPNGCGKFKYNNKKLKTTFKNGKIIELYGDLNSVMDLNDYPSKMINLRPPIPQLNPQKLQHLAPIPEQETANTSQPFVYRIDSAVSFLDDN